MKQKENPEFNSTVTIDDENITYVERIKFLGVEIDKSLNWNTLIPLHAKWMI